MRTSLLRTPLFAAAIVKDAIATLGRHWRPLAVALIVPALGMATVRQLLIRFSEYVAVQWLLVAPRLAFYVLFAMTCHRIILLGEAAIPNRLGVYWSMRELRFAGWVLFVGAVTLAVWVSSGQLFLLADYGSLPFQFVWYGIYFVATWLGARIGMVFPATAIGEPANLAGSWRLTRGHGLAIAIALFVLILAGDLLFLLVDSGLMRAAPPNIAWFVRDLVEFPLLAAGVAVLSVSYRLLQTRRQLGQPPDDVKNI